MVPVRYGGIPDPRQAFAALKPARSHIIQLQQRLRPQGSDYLILSALLKAMDTAAYHFTSEPDFFSLKPQQSSYKPPEA